MAGIVLTGGASRRMGFDKASMSVDGVPCAERTARLLQTVVSVAVEVGPGVSGLPAVEEDLPGSGPLVAVVAGAAELRRRGHVHGALVLACDLPLLTEAVLTTIARWPGDGSVVPVVEGRPQPLCARWSADDLDVAGELAGTGNRSMRALLERPGVVLIDEASWPGDVDRSAFADADTPTDLDRLGVRWRPGTSAAEPHSDRPTAP